MMKETISIRSVTTCNCIFMPKHCLWNALRQSTWKSHTFTPHARTHDGHPFCSFVPISWREEGSQISIEMELTDKMRIGRHGKQEPSQLKP